MYTYCLPELRKADPARFDVVDSIGGAAKNNFKIGDEIISKTIRATIS